MHFAAIISIGGMMQKKDVATLIRENKTVFIIIAVILFLVELEIFALAAMKAGRRSWLQFVDVHGNVVHETDGKNLSDFNKYYFEKNFGPVTNYQRKLVSKEFEFPFRAWFVAAVGIPIGIMLLLAFTVKAYISFMYGTEDKKDGTAGDYQTQMERMISSVSRFNIFTIGFLVLLGVFCYWVIPETITYLGRVGEETISKYRWVFISAAAVLVCLMVWIIYLRYLLAVKTIDSQVELDKYRLQLGLDPAYTAPIQLEYKQNGNQKAQQVGWNGNPPQKPLPEQPQIEVTDTQPFETVQNQTGA